MLLSGGPRGLRAISLVVAVLVLAVWCLSPNSPSLLPCSDCVPQWASSKARLELNAPQPSPTPGTSSQHSLETPKDPKTGDDETQPPAPQYRLPQAYFKVPEQAPFCSKRFGIPYLEDLRDSAADYCTPESSLNSSSDLTCFHSQTTGTQVDSMCIGRNARFDDRAHEFRVGCELVNPETPSTTTKTGVPVPEWQHFAAYMYETGPGYILDEYLNAGRRESKDKTGQEKEKKEVMAPTSTSNYTILVKREGEGNLWHCLVEPFSMFLSMDVLQMSPRPGDGRPFFTETDIAKTPRWYSWMTALTGHTSISGPSSQRSPCAASES